MRRVIYGSAIENTLGYSPITHAASLGRLKTAQQAELNGFKFDKSPGYLYVAVRAVSSRVNQNYDGFTGEELRRAYATFIGRPVFVNHENSDINRARGFVIDAKLHDDDPEDVWVEVLHELDAKTYPQLCAAIAKGEINTTSMGCDITHSECSVCGIQARFPSEFCSHIKNKGSVFERKTASGGLEKVLAYEDCQGVNFFEDSWVFNPADSSAVIQGVLDEGMRVAQTNSETHRPEAVDTLRSVMPCPQCGNQNFDGVVCNVCGFTDDMPDTTKAPDTDTAKKDTNIPVETEDPKSVADVEDKNKDKSKKESAMKTAAVECPTCGKKSVTKSSEKGFAYVCGSCGAGWKDLEDFHNSKDWSDFKKKSNKTAGDDRADKVIKTPHGTFSKEDNKGGEEPVWTLDENGKLVDLNKSKTATYNTVCPICHSSFMATVNNENTNARRGGMDMPRTNQNAIDAARARFHKAQVDTGVADLTTDVTNLDGESSVPATITPDATTTVDAVGGEVAVTPAPVEDVTAIPKAEVAPVNDPMFPVATDPGVVTAPANPPVFSEETAPDVGLDGAAAGTIEPLPSVTAARTAFIAGMRLVEARISAGLEPRNVEKVALADRFSRSLTVREMDTASKTISEILTKQASLAQHRSMVPRREEVRVPVSLDGTRTASSDNIPAEAIFGL